MKSLLSTLLIATCSFTGFSQGWKHDIQFTNAGSASTQTMKAVIDEDDNTYTFLVKPSPGVYPFSYFIHKNGPDGTLDYAQYLSYLTPNNTTSEHHDGGLAVDQNHVYYTSEFVLSNGGTCYINRIDKNNPSNSSTFASFLNWCQITELKIVNDNMYVYGYFVNNGMQLEILDPSTTAPSDIFLNPVSSTGRKTAFVAMYNISQPDLIWARTVFQSGESESSSMEIDNNGRVYLAGFVAPGSVLGGTSTFTFNTTAGTEGFLIRLNSSGIYDGSFTPVQVPVTVAGTVGKVDDLELDPQTNHIYLTAGDRMRKYSTNTTVGSPTPSLIWGHVETDSYGMRLAISDCNEMYLTGSYQPIKPTYSYFAKSFNKNTGIYSGLLNSAPFGGVLNSQGEGVLIQSDGDKVIFGDYYGDQVFAIDYDQYTPNPTGTVTYTMSSARGLFLGVYDDGVKGELSNDFLLKKVNGTETYTFGCWEDIIFDGSASKNETNHFIDLWKSSGTSFQYHGGFGWLGGQAGIHNISNLAASSNPAISLTPGTYRIKLAVQNACIGWMEKVVTFTITGETLCPTFSHYMTMPQSNAYNIIDTSCVNPPHVEHLWYIYNVNAGTIVTVSPWSTNPIFTYSGLASGTTYNIIHVVRDPKGCAPQVSHYIQITQGKKTLIQGTITPEMEQLLKEIENGNYDLEGGRSLPEISIMPNPAADLVTVESKNGRPETIQLLTMNGKELQRVAYEDQIKLDVSALPSGVYLIKVNYADGYQVVERLIKQ